VDLVIPAIAIAGIGLIQDAGVSRSVANPGGEYDDDSRQFAAQGVANAAVSLLRGMPIGGSVSASALNVSSGARSRWANVYAGVIVAVVLLLFGSAIEKVPMATVAALFIVAAVGSLKLAAILEVWRTNWAARVIMLTNLVLTLMLPIQYAVLVGVAISTIQYISSASLDVKIRRLVRQEEGRFSEEDPPERVPDREVTILDIYGSICFAAADAIAAKLPDVRDAQRAVLVPRLRSRGEVGSSAIGLFRRYATNPQRNGRAPPRRCRPRHGGLAEAHGHRGPAGEHTIFPARSPVYRSTEAAFDEGRRRLIAGTPT